MTPCTPPDQARGKAEGMIFPVKHLDYSPNRHSDNPLQPETDDLLRLCTAIGLTLERLSWSLPSGGDHSDFARAGCSLPRRGEETPTQTDESRGGHIPNSSFV